jgi:hypothetical protein
VPDISVKTYVKGQELNYENLEGGSLELYLDKGDYYAFVVDRVDVAQSDLAFIPKWAEDASQRMKIKIDSAVLGAIYPDVNVYNKGTSAGIDSRSYNLGTTGSPVALDKSNVLDTIVHMGTVLDEQNIPETGRYLVIPPWVANRIKRSDLKDASLAGDGTSIMRNGRLGIIDRFTLYMSNLLPWVTDGSNRCWHIMGGHKAGLTFASQLVENESMPSPKTFGTLFRGLQVYGYKVVKGDCLVDLYARPA